jgi:hypothetical protein
MTEVCHYCGALKNHGETKGMCIYTHTMEQENPFYTRKHCEIKRITNVPYRATARRGGAQVVYHKSAKQQLSSNRGFVFSV